MGCVLGCHEQNRHCQTIVDSLEITWALGSEALSSLRSVRLRMESSLKAELGALEWGRQFLITALGLELHSLGGPSAGFLTYNHGNASPHFGWVKVKAQRDNVFVMFCPEKLPEDSYWNKPGALHSLTLLDFKVAEGPAAPSCSNTVLIEVSRVLSVASPS